MNTTQHSFKLNNLNLLILLLALLGFSKSYSQQQDMNFSPEGKLEDVYDRFGTKHKLKDILIDPPTEFLIQKATSLTCVSTSYFNLFFEPGSGMENTSDNTQNSRRAVVCKVFEDVSNFIVSPLASSVNKVNIVVKNFANENAPAGTPAMASSFFVAPSNTTNTTPGILDGEVWKTIHLGVDSYTSVGQATNTFYHGMVAVNFNDTNIQWHTDLGTNAPSNLYDLYSVVLHEVMHALGLHSFIDENGGSLTEANYYTRFDTFLKTNSNVPLLTIGSCSMFDVSFNSANILPTVLRPGCTLTDNVNPNNPLNITLCNNAIKYIGSSQTPVPVYTPTCYETGSSLSHFEDMLYPSCATNNGNDAYFVVSNGVFPGVTKRNLTPEEVNALCDIGYQYNYGVTSCTGITVAGLDDGVSAGNYTFMGSIATTGGTSTIVNIQGLIANDPGATNFECLQDITAPATIFNTSGTISTVSTFTTTTPGLHLLRYVPFNIVSQQRGNITYVWVYIIPPFSPGSCSPVPTNVCDLVLNGDFEQFSSLPTYEFQITKACGWSWPSTIVSYAPTYYNSAVVPTDPSTSVDIPCNKNGYQNCKSNIGNGYADIYRSAHVGRKHLLTKLKTALQPNTTYQLTFDVSLQEGKSNYAGNIQAYLSNNLVGLNPFNIELNSITNPSMFFTSAGIPTNTTAWETVTFNFTTTTGNEQYLYLGFLKNSALVANTPAIVPTCNFDDTTNNNSIDSQILGYYVDNVSLIPTNGAVFNLPATICTNQVLSNLTTYLSGVPTTGVFTVNGVALTGGSFNASVPGIGTTTIGYTYTNSSNCVTTLYDTITITNVNNVTPTFSFVTNLCNGATAPLLPTTSNNGVTGTWSPATVSNTATGTYVFSPTVGQCANTLTKQVTVNALPIITSVLPATQTVCLNAAPISLHITATATGITYQWYKNTVNSSTGGTLITGATTFDYTPPTNVVGTKYYYVIVKNTSNCTATSAVVAVIVASGTANAGTLSGTQTLCKIGKANPTTVFTASVAGGTWSSSNPAIATIISTTTTPSTTATIRVLPGTATITYTVTGASGCTKSVTRTVTTLMPTVPTFTQFPINLNTGVPDPIVMCAGATPPLLPITSANGISGTWSPTAISNTATGDYIFTPTSGLCAYGVSQSVVVINTTDFVANADSFFMTQPTASSTTDTVFVNDTYNGNFLTTADITSYITHSATLTGTLPTIPSGGINFNTTTGAFTVLPGTPAGTYTYHYVLQTPCGATTSPATVNIVISSYVIGMTRSEYTFCFNNNSPTVSTSNIDPTNQQTLYDGTIINGVPASSTNAGIFMVSPTNASLLPAGIVINADGTFTIPAGTLPANYNFVYKICSGGYCSSPINWNVVIKSPLRLFHDTATYNISGNLQGGGTFNVLTNDLRNLCDTTYNGTYIPLALNSVHVTGSNTTPAYFTISNTGNISSNSSANPNGSGIIPIGTYTLSYTVCDATYTSICATQTVTITVTNTFKMAANISSTVVVHGVTNTTKNALQIINFPDANLKAKLLDSATCFNTTDGDFILADSNGDGEIDTNEALQIGRVNLSSANINDLTGLEYFTNLTSIALYQNNVTSFNITLPNLSILTIPYNPLTNLNTTVLPNLSLIGCSNTLLTSLDNTNNSLLNIVNVDDTHIGSLDLGICHNLTYLFCSNNPNLTTINIKNVSSLDYGSTFMQQDCWLNCPNLNNICADDFEIPALLSYLAGCGVSTSGININSACALGVTPFSANTIAVNPNPVTNILTIDFGTPVAETSSYAVYDVLGKKIVEGTIAAGANSVSIPFENYPNGVYLLRLNAGDKIISKKIVKE